MWMSRSGQILCPREGAASRVFSDERNLWIRRPHGEDWPPTGWAPPIAHGLNRPQGRCFPQTQEPSSHSTASDLEHCWFFSLMAFGVKLGHRPADLEGVCSHNQTSS